MSSDDKPKTAVELAMERLRRKDADTGVVEKPITEERKAAIAEARSLHASKTAEVEILHRAKIGDVHNPDDRTKADAEYRRELQRLNDDLERRIERIRREGD